MQRNNRSAGDAATRRTERLVALVVIGILAFNYPLLYLFKGPGMLFGIPLLYLYLFVVWAVLLGLVAYLLEYRSIDTPTNGNIEKVPRDQ
jgi:uncharacterized membrane protein YvlD (DUF360 family)